MVKWTLADKIKVVPANTVEVGDYVHPYGRSPGGIVTQAFLSESANQGGYDMIIGIEGRETNMVLPSAAYLHVSRKREVES